MKKILCTKYPSSRKAILSSEDMGDFIVFSWKELCDKFDYEYYPEDDQETIQDLESTYGLKFLGYAVEKKDLEYLNPDSDPDTQEAITSMYVEAPGGETFLCQYSRGALRDVETGHFIKPRKSR